VPDDSSEPPPPPPGASLDEAAKAMQLEGLFLFALVWSTGASCDAAGRAKFDRFFRSVSQGTLSRAPASTQLSPSYHTAWSLCSCRVLAAGGVPEGYEAHVPAKRPLLTAPPIPDVAPDGSWQSVYDFKYDRPACRWVAWVDTITPLAIPTGAAFADIMVPTKDTARCGHVSLMHQFLGVWPTMLHTKTKA
jgi:dynein heavy chain